MADQSSGKTLEDYEALGAGVFAASTFKAFARWCVDTEQIAPEDPILRALVTGDYSAFVDAPRGLAFFLGVNCVTCDVLLSEAGVTSKNGRVTCNVCGRSAIPE